MIKEVASYRTSSGAVVILSHNGSSWYVNQWGQFGTFSNKRTKFGSDKHKALAFYATCERELVVIEAMKALGIERR